MCSAFSRAGSTTAAWHEIEASLHALFLFYCVRIPLCHAFAASRHLSYLAPQGRRQWKHRNSFAHGFGAARANDEFRISRALQQLLRGGGADGVADTEAAAEPERARRRRLGGDALMSALPAGAPQVAQQDDGPWVGKAGVCDEQRVRLRVELEGEPWPRGALDCGGEVVERKHQVEGVARAAD
eukprot:6181233-Pleurochrysis_carterae.AAC.2